MKSKARIIEAILCVTMVVFFGLLVYGNMR